MIKVSFNARAYVLKNGQLMIRVRWNSKKNEVAFSVGYTIDPTKWDSTKQLVKANSTHRINGKTVYAREINNTIRTVLGCIEEVFTEYSLRNEIPGNADLKELVNEKLGRNKPKVVENDKEKTLKDIFKEFLSTRALEGNWSKEAEYKYEQMWQQLTSCDEAIELDALDKNKMTLLSRKSG